MDKNKGFTIPELLAVIVIIGILTVMAVGTYTGVSNRIKAKALEQKLSYYKEKAYEYASDNVETEETFTLTHLADLGYIEVDHIENPEFERIDNPVTGGFLDCMSFTAVKNLTDYEITYDLESSCDLVTSERRQQEVEIDKYIKRNNSYQLIEDQWVNEPVYLHVRLQNYNVYNINDNIIFFNGTINGTNDKKYCDTLEDLEDPENNCYNFYKVDTDYIYNNNYIISMNISDKLDNTGKTYRISKNVKIKIDKEKPKLKVSYNNAYTKENLKIDAIGSDGLGSGIMGYYIGENKLSDNTEFSEDSSLEIEANGTYYIYAKDNAGNISEEEVINITNIDKEGPISLTISPRSSWSKDDYTLTFGCDTKKTKTGCANNIQYTIVDLTNNKVLANNITVNNSKTTYTISTDDDTYIEKISLKYTIEDNLHNKKEINIPSLNVKIDKVIPKFTITHSVSKRKGGLFNCCYEGADYTLRLSVDSSKYVPSGINTNKDGFSTSNTDPTSYENYSEAQLDEIFSHKGKSYSLFVAKRSSTKVSGRVVSNSGVASYGVIGLTGNGCTEFAAWTIGGLLLGGLLGGLIGWGICNAN